MGGNMVLVFFYDEKGAERLGAWEAGHRKRWISDSEKELLKGELKAEAVLLKGEAEAMKGA